jgi:hypothetical protein
VNDDKTSAIKVTVDNDAELKYWDAREISSVKALLHAEMLVNELISSGENASNNELTKLSIKYTEPSCTCAAWTNAVHICALRAPLASASAAVYEQSEPP